MESNDKHPLVKKILFSNEEIVAGSKKIAEEVSSYYAAHAEEPIICLGLLKGCIPFLAEFIKHLTIECQVDFMLVTSFCGGIEATGNPQIKLDLASSIINKDILIVEDIIDSGKTLKLVKEYLYLKGAKSVKIVTLLDKVENHKNGIQSDWSVFEVQNAFLIGFGLDYAEKLRNLPYVAIADTAKLDDFYKKHGEEK